MKRITFSVLLAVLFVACNHKNAYNIKGETGDKTLEGRQVSLMSQSGNAGMLTLDSTIIKDGTFHLKGNVDSTGWYILFLKKTNGEPIYKDFYVEGDLKATIQNDRIRIAGGTVNDGYQAFEDQYEALTVNVVRLNTQLNANPQNKELEKAFSDEYGRFEKAVSELALSTVMKNIDNPLGLHIFQAALSSFQDQEIESVLAKAGPAFLADPSVKMVASQLNLSKKVSIGHKFTDLKMSKPDGAPISLSEYIGKGTYVMIDFWASWCAPCMRDLPNVMASYKKYHSKGFDVVGVSLDEDAKAWKAAIVKNKIPWPQMSDLAGWKSQAVSVYSFSSIPHTILVDPKGIIVAKDLRGSDLDAKLAELLNK